MIKYLKMFIVIIGFATSVNGQIIDYKQPLPIDKRIKKGVLPNGLTYYLHSTNVTENVASFYIIQNVGSILENDDQQGLAHFLEHMAFNGTENFEGKGILNTFQTHGLIFGKDINAYTSFDETVYNINNVPTTPELIDKGLLVLKDWSNYLLLTEEEIDAERGVIKEEWRTRQNGGMRILQKSLPTKFNNSKYANRLPIGLMDIVENFEYKALRDFYHDWYRTDLQAIAIVGDFSVSEMEQKIIEKFSNIPPVKNPLKRIVVSIPDNKELMFEMAMDNEIATSSISFNIRHNKSLKDATVADLKENLINSMITSMFSARISELAQDPAATFVGARVGYQDSWARLHKEFSISISPKPDKQQLAFKAILTEVNRAIKFGFTDPEIDRTQAQFINYYENRIAKIDDVSHGRVVKTIQANFLENAHITDLVQEYELVKDIFKSLKAEEIQTRLQEMYAKKNRYIIVTGVEGNKNLTKEEAVSIIKSVESDSTIKPYTEDSEGKSLLDGVKLTSGKIIAAKVNSEIESTTFTLSNGIKVHYKFADKNKNDVRLNAISDGGKSLISTKDYASNDFLGSFIGMSGLGEFSSTELPKILAGKSASTSVRISDISENVAGNSSTKDVETMLQMVNLRFTHPRFDEASYQVLLQQLDNHLIQKGADLKSKMADSITATLYGEMNPKKRILTKDYISEVSFERMKAIYNDRFSNAADFQFFIVGDVKQEKLMPLLEKYIASIPTNTIRENWVDNGAKWLNKNIDKDIYLEMEDPKASVRYAVKNEMPYSLKNNYLMRVLSDILQLRLTASLREEEGGTYGAGTWGTMMKKPVQQAYLSVSFDCNPDKVEDLITIVNNEILKIKDGIIKQEDLDKTLTNYLKDREEQKNYNSYEMRLLTNYFLNGYNMDEPKNFESIINSIKFKDVQEITKRLFDNSESFEIVFKPKS